MQVVATAGHVDHGKSTLVRALTGTDPDRLDEEHRRGLTIELGHCWTTLPGVGDVAFVDVPGHERFLTTMLAGIGPVPAALLVVAADDPWMPQAAEHLAALDALGVRHGVVAVTRADLADPGPAAERARVELAATSLAGAPVVVLSGRTGAGLAGLRTALADVLSGLPAPDPPADVRLWVDRRFTVHGAGTVVTGTLPAGTVAPGDELAHGDRTLRVRGVQSLGRRVSAASGVARVALNLVGDDGGLRRGSALLTPGRWPDVTVLDARVPAPAGELPRHPLLHVGAAAVTVRARPLGGDLVRITTEQGLPLRIGDRAILRDPGSRRLWGLVVLDPAPPQLHRRGAARDRAAELAGVSGAVDPAGEVARRGPVSVDELARLGAPVAAPLPEGILAVGDHLLTADRAARLRRRTEELVGQHARANPLDPGLPLTVLAARLPVPTPEVAAALVPGSLRVVRGRVLAADVAGLPEALEQALATLGAELRAAPFAAPTADRLRELGLDARAVGAAVRADRVLRLAPGIVLLPDAARLAASWLAELQQPFTVSEARRCLGTSRRVALPLLVHLDRAGHTRRLPDDRRTVVDAGANRP